MDSILPNVSFIRYLYRLDRINRRIKSLRSHDPLSEGAPPISSILAEIEEAAKTLRDTQVLRESLGEDQSCGAIFEKGKSWETDDEINTLSLFWMDFEQSLEGL
jgi:hypothetical protein